MLGLTWNDVNLSEKYIHINSAVTPKKGTSIEDDTKSISSNRIIPIDDELNNMLIKNNTFKTITTPVYMVTGMGSFMSPSGYAKKFKRDMTIICNKLEIPLLTPHELRHTFGTLLRENGSDIYTIQKAMGHSDISITAKTYVHNDINVLRKAMMIDKNSEDNLSTIEDTEDFLKTNK